MNNCSNVMVTMSLGNREYIKYTKPFMVDYSKRTGSELFIIDDSNLKEFEFVHNKDLIDITTGRGNNKSYLFKVLLIMHFAEIYDKILWVDDTCFIKNSCANLFSMVEDSCIMAYNEGENRELNSWKDNQSYIKSVTDFSIDTNNYINSGVVLYTKDINKYLNNETLIKHKSLFNNPYPHQCFLNFVIQYYKIKLKLIDSSYNQIFMNCSYSSGRNTTPEMIGDEFVSSNKNSIFHITGFYRNRLAIIKYIYNTLATN